MKLIISFNDNLNVNAFAGSLEFLFHDYEVKDDIIYTTIDGYEYTKSSKSIQVIVENTILTIKLGDIKSILINN